MSTIRLAQRILLLDRGRVIATGSHESLLASEPRYREVLARQAEEEAALLASGDGEDESDADFRRRIASLLEPVDPDGGLPS